MSPARLTVFPIGDVNSAIEAMTEGGCRKKGVLFAPRDALEEDPVVLKYAMGYVDKVEMLKEDSDYRIGDIPFSTDRMHQRKWKLLASISGHHPARFPLSRI